MIAAAIETLKPLNFAPAWGHEQSLFSNHRHDVLAIWTHRHRQELINLERRRLRSDMSGDGAMGEGGLNDFKDLAWLLRTLIEKTWSK